MLYIGMERTRIYHELRLRMDSPRTETASRWFIMRYLLTTVDGKQPSYVRFHAYTHIYTYTYTVYSFVCREYRSFAFAEWWIKIDFFLMSSWTFTCLHLSKRDQKIETCIIHCLLKKKYYLFGLILENRLSLIGLNWIEDIQGIKLISVRILVLSNNLRNYFVANFTLKIAIWIIHGIQSEDEKM